MDDSHNYIDHFCVNQDCPSYGKKGDSNIRRRGGYGKVDKRDELYCNLCNKSFSEFFGTLFHHAKLPVEKIVSIIHHLLEGCGVRPTGRLLHVHRDTVVRYLRIAAMYLTPVLNELLVDLSLKEVQLDEFWTFVRKKEKNASDADKAAGFGDRWVHLAIDAVTRLVAGWQVGRRTKAATEALVSDVAGRQTDPKDSLYTSDQHEPYRSAIEEKVVAAGAPLPGAPGVVYGTVNKTFRGGECAEIKRELTIGEWEDLTIRLDASPVSMTINTAFIERLNSTFRWDVRRVSRKSLGFSKMPDALESHIVLHVAYYDFVRPHWGLPNALPGERRPKGLPNTTPAMAAGILDRPWSLLELLLQKVAPRKTAPILASGGVMGS